MQTRVLFATALAAAGALAGCSRPAPTQGPAGDRHLLLAQPPAPEAVVSDLEAGRAAKAAPGRAAPRLVKASPDRRARQALVAEALAPAGHGHAMVSELVPIRESGGSVIPATAAPQPVEAAPESEGPALGTVWHGHGNASLPAGHEQGLGGGPVIILRGGRGGPDDDCDLRNTLHPRGGGSAVNRMAPSFGGYTRTRGGIR